MAKLTATKIASNAYVETIAEALEVRWTDMAAARRMIREADEAAWAAGLKNGHLRKLWGQADDLYAARRGGVRGPLPGRA